MTSPAPSSVSRWAPLCVFVVVLILCLVLLDAGRANRAKSLMGTLPPLESLPTPGASVNLGRVSADVCSLLTRPDEVWPWPFSSRVVIPEGWVFVPQTPVCARQTRTVVYALRR